MIDRELLSVLACPLCPERPPLTERGEYLVCTKCGYGYPVIEDIPQLLPEDAIAPDALKDLLSGPDSV
jgi:uncharacterized protein